MGKILIPKADSRTTEFFFTIIIITIIDAAVAVSQVNKLRLKKLSHVITEQSTTNKAESILQYQEWTV